MKKILKEIKETYEPMKTEIMLMILFVLVFIVLNGGELAREASVAYGGGGTSVRATGGDGAPEISEREPESERESETEQAALTPAELAAAQADDEQEGSGREQDPLQWKRLLMSVPEDLQIPMAMPAAEEAPVEYRPTLFELLSGDSGAQEKRPGIAEYRSFDMLRRQVQKQVSGFEGDWSVYVKNLKTGENFVINDQPMKSASVMKLFVMGTVYKAIEKGELERTEEIVSLLNRMITESDNEASNQLLYRLGDSSYAGGIEKVDAFIREYGFSDMTVEYNGFNSSETVMDPGHNNQVSAKDCGKLLEDIYRREWVNRSTGAEIEQMMLNQQTRYKIPAGLPEGVLCGNKTGEMETTENDAAIIYGEECDYILVVLSSDWGSKDQAIRRISDLSELVYGYLNG